jgi:ABC-type multidrug transport system fused ATPase/permease subunit
MRENLDPTEDFSDDQCAGVLARVCASLVTPQAWTLNTHVESGGRNFSQGQRQVIGVARAILRRSPIVILDEAMASIDSATAVQLQNLLREELAGATLVVIAHRVEEEAVEQADYEVILENGKVVRQGLVDKSSPMRVNS